MASVVKSVRGQVRIAGVGAPRQRTPVSIMGALAARPKDGAAFAVALVPASASRDFQAEGGGNIRVVAEGRRRPSPHATVVNISSPRLCQADTDPTEGLWRELFLLKPEQRSLQHILATFQPEDFLDEEVRGHARDIPLRHPD